MPVICPAILAATEDEYRQQLERIVHLTQRVQIDLTDRHFAPSTTIRPEEAWWPVGFKADIHLMYRQPLQAAQAVLAHKPNLIIVHAEADGEFHEVAAACHHYGIKTGIALLPRTPAEQIFPALESIDYVLIFSGELGHFGGHADFSLLEKVGQLKSRKPNIEIGWDGGINDQNVAELINGGVDVLNVGGYIQQAEDPVKAFMALQRIADETGTT